ncbi:ABC transporter ATP-binding protein [Kutzneria sp. CA-103260]|nr:ABC transporter ATP-binding protein [Kutzneria sp. CA-103260]
MLARLYRPDRSRLVAGVFLFAVKHSPNWLLPLVTAEIVDTVVRHDPIAHLWQAAGLVTLMLALNPPVHLLYVRCVYGSARRASTALRSALCQRIQTLSVNHSQASASVLQTKVLRDVEAVEEMVQQTADNGLGAITVLVGGLVVIGLRSPEFVPVVMVVVPLAGLLVLRLRERMRQHNEEYRREVENLSERVAEMTHLLPITRAHGLERTALRRMDGVLQRVLSAGLRLDRLNGRFGAFAWVLLNTLGVVFLAGAALVAYYRLLPVTAGDVVLLSTFVTLLTANMTGLLTLVPVISRGLESVRSIGEVLQATELEPNEGRRPVRAVAGAVEFRRVDFAHHRNGPRAVRDFSLAVSPGETVAIVGPSGAGKSTLLKLVLGLIRPTGGQLLLDGVDVETLDLRSYRRFVSFVPQDPVLFDGSVRDNVVYGLDNVDDDRLRAALRDAYALEFVDRLPHGVDTFVGEHGTRLSGGQKQRLAIARALIRDPSVLVLDEATSALDSRAEGLVQEALGRLAHGRTTFVVAHRLSTVRDADRIVVMCDGRIEEIGTHHDLLSLGGTYTRLQDAQLA